MNSIEKSENHPNLQCKDCEEPDNLTQKSINLERIKICNSLYDSSGTVATWETKFDGENKLYGQKKCLFKWTEGNYRRYRNLEISAGIELLQTNESVKTNVSKFNNWNKDLNTVLKDIAKKVKEAKSKFSELKAAADKLEDCTKDRCNIAQWKALTGKNPENCQENEHKLPIEACKDSDKMFHDLICKPKGLALDIDSIFLSSADVVGIQVFSNIETLEPLQKTLDDQSKDFEKYINERMKDRESELKKLQEDLIKSVQEITKSAMDRNNKRSDFEGYYDAVDYLCCPICDCVKDHDNEDTQRDNDCEKECLPRLKDCEKAICKVCEEVKDTFCCPEVKDKPKDMRTEFSL